jgi:anaerobic ribonucleoside-triphosphate reductase activating protein
MLSTFNIAYPLSSTFIDYPDNESIAVVIYFMGCEQNCIGCHNPKFRDICNKENTIHIGVNDLLSIIYEGCTRNKTNKIVFSGGDPLHPENIEGVKELLDKLRDLYKIVLYTSYDIEYIKEKDVEGFSFIKSGVFNKDLYQASDKNDQCMVFASKNQKLYDNKLNLLSTEGVYHFEQGL